MATAIEFNNISKLYRLGLVGTGTLARDLVYGFPAADDHKADGLPRLLLASLTSHARKPQGILHKQ